jgi:glycosyltransferase involved in cell wall biosynthesis
MLLNAAFPPDIRLEKEIGTLSEHHEIFLLCTRHGDAPDSEMLPGVTVTRVLGGIQRRWATLQLMRRCYSSIWRKHIDRFIDANGIDVLHVHDLPLAGTAVRSGESRGIPVILDLHEDYPAMLAEMKKTPWTRSPSLGVLGLKLAPSIPHWREYEKAILQKADEVIVVIEESADRIAHLGVDRRRIHVVPNYAPRPVKPMHERPRSPRVQVIYIGGFDQMRDLRTVLRASSILAARESAVQVDLIGGSARDIDLLGRFADREGLDIGRVTFTKWMERDKAEALLEHAAIGLVPHVKSPHTDTTVPHKLFQYMAAGLPVIVSDCAPVQRIVVTSDCGLVYEDGNATSLADAIERLAGDPETRQRMGDNGRAAVMSKFNWESAGQRLLDVYETVSTPPVP